MFVPLHLVVSVPSRGLVVFITSSEHQVPAAWPMLISVPSRGLIIFLLDGSRPTARFTSRPRSFSPLSGDCLFLTRRHNHDARVLWHKASVPSWGLVVFLPFSLPKLSVSWGSHFSPLAGIDCFSTRFGPLRKAAFALGNARFSPLSGDCLFLTGFDADYTKWAHEGFQSPQRGLFNSYNNCGQSLMNPPWGFSPHTGIGFKNKSAPFAPASRGEGD